MSPSYRQKFLRVGCERISRVGGRVVPRRSLNSPSTVPQQSLNSPSTVPQQSLNSPSTEPLRSIAVPHAPAYIYLLFVCSRFTFLPTSLPSLYFWKSYFRNVHIGFLTHMGGEGLAGGLVGGRSCFALGLDQNFGDF